MSRQAIYIGKLYIRTVFIYKNYRMGYIVKYSSLNTQGESVQVTGTYYIRKLND